MVVVSSPKKGERKGRGGRNAEEEPREFFTRAAVGWREGRGRFGIEQAYVVERDVARLHER